MGMAIGPADPEIAGENDTLVEAMVNERNKYIICSFGGNKQSHVEMASTREAVYGPATDDACQRFIDVQCVNAIRGNMPKTELTPEMSVQQLEQLNAIDSLTDYIKTLERGYVQILEMSGTYEDDAVRLDQEEVFDIVNSVYTPDKRIVEVTSDLPMDRAFTSAELGELLRGPFASIASNAVFNSDNNSMTVGAMRAKFRAAMAKFKVDIRLTQNPYMVGEDGFPYIILVSAKNNLGKEVVSVACTDSDIADSYRDYAKHVAGGRDFTIKIIPVNYLPMKDIMDSLIENLNGPDFEFGKGD